MTAQQVTSPLGASSPVNSNIRKRVRNACDRCRLKKSKCDEATPCSQCEADNAICLFGPRVKSRDKVYPKGYVEMLEQQQTQLIIGLQELYRRIEHGQGWLGSSLKESSNGRPLTYDILKRLGALKQDEHSSSETFEEDPSLMQQRLIASGVGSIRRQDSSDCSSDRGHSPIFESIQSKSPILSDHFAVNQFPPTRPNHSSCPRALQTPFQIEAKTYVQPTPMQSDQSWTEPAIGFDDNMDLIRRSSQLNQQTMRMAAANPCLGMPDWNDEDDFKTFGFTLL